MSEPITIEDILNLYENYGVTVEINDGYIVAFNM